MNADDEEGVWLVAYGTLRDPAVQLSVFGREPASDVDALTGFRLAAVAIGGETYRTLRAASEAADRIEGVALQLRASELARGDAYEGDTDYQRINVTLESGRDAWVYVSNSA